VSADLARVSGTGPVSAMTLRRLEQRLIDNRGLAPGGARWAVESWAVALGVIARGEPRPAQGRDQAVKADQARRPEPRPLASIAERGRTALVGALLAAAGGLLIAVVGLVALDEFALLFLPLRGIGAGALAVLVTRARSPASRSFLAGALFAVGLSAIAEITLPQT
jgi:hypothetical protein